MSPPRRTLVLLRHGRTAWNASRRVQGQSDADLDATGHAQAVAMAPALAALRPARLATSDLARARATAAYLATETGLVPAADPRLREYHLGDREGVWHDDYAAAHPQEHARFVAGDFDVVPGGETARQVRERMLAALAELLDATPEGGVAVAVSHGAAIKVATAGLLGWPHDAHLTLRGVENCAWVELETGPAPGPGGAREAGAAARPMRLRAYNRRAGGLA